MPQMMRCQFCGTLQDEPAGPKVCVQCGGELAFEMGPLPDERDSYVKVQMELDQVNAPAGQKIERHLLISLRTPVTVPPSQAAPTTLGRAPLNLAAVLDISGSMSGEKLEQAKEALRQALHHLRDGDVVSLVVFSTEVRCVFEPQRLNSHTRGVILSALKEINTQSNTNLCGGLVLGSEKISAAKMKTNLLLLLSDGLANEGETDLQKIGQHAYAAREQGITISTFGVGGDYNEALMVEIADQGGGRFYHVEKAAEIGAYLTGELGEITNLSARNTCIHLALPSGATLLPPSAAYPVEQKPNEATVRVGVVPSETELEIPIGMVLPAQPEGKRLSVEGALTYESPAGNMLKSSLNRVTLRVVDPTHFNLRDGAIAPVIEKVLAQMKAEHVLALSRTMRQEPEEAEKEQAARVESLRAYATLLSDERAAQETAYMQDELQDMTSSPLTLKSTVAAASSLQRGTRVRNTRRAAKRDGSS